MKGLEPSTFCMASARDVRTRSRPFARAAVFAGSSSERANAREAERTPNLAILSRTPAGSWPPVADPLRAQEGGRRFESVRGDFHAQFQELEVAPGGKQ